MPVIVQTVTGKVTGLWGSAQIRLPDGSMRDVQLGDIVNRGDVLLTSEDGIVQLTPEQNLPNPIPPLPTEPPEAGPQGGGEGSLQEGLRVERVVEAVTPASLITTPIAAATPAFVAGTAPQQGNRAPLADAASRSGNEDTPQPISLTGRDTDGTVTAVTITALPTNGTLTTATGVPVAVGQVLTPAQAANLVFTPAPNFNGNTGVSFTVTDDQGAVSAPATVSIAVLPVNDGPSAIPGALTVAEDTPLPISLRGTDPDGTVASVTVTTLPANGTLTLANGTPVVAGQVLTPAQAAALTFTPGPNFNGNTGITFTVTDNEGAVSPPATVAISVTPVNDPPVPVITPASGDEDTPIPVKLGGTDVDGTVDAVTVTKLPDNGALFLADGTTPVTAGAPLTPAQAASLVFVPNPNFNGPVAIEFTVTDDTGATSPPATLPITVNPVNDPPAAVVTPATGDEDTPIPVKLGGTDPDGTIAAVTVTKLPDNGTLFLPDGKTPVTAGTPLTPDEAANLVFVPAPNYNGPVTIEFTVTDNGGATSPPATLPITVTPVNDPPVAVVTPATGEQGTPIPVKLGGTDPDGTVTAVTVTQLPDNGTLFLPDGKTPVVPGTPLTPEEAAGLVFVPAPGYAGPATIGFTVTDNGGTTSPPATLPITVTPVVPSITIDDVTVNEAAGVATFTVTLSAPTASTVSVNYSTSSGTATSGVDFTPTTGTLTFAPGVTTLTISVPITDDKIYEISETFNVNLSAPANATIADPLGIGTIKDDGTGPGGNDNDAPQITVTGGNVVEGSPAVFTVSLSNPSTQPVVFTPSLSSGTATVGTDTAPLSGLQVSTDGGTTWQPVSGNVTIPPGATSVLVRLATIDDLIAETPETFSLTATPVSGAAPAPATGTSTIIDNDGPPSIFINDVTVNEGAGTATFTVTLSSASGLPVTVGFNTSNGTATAGSDYTSTTGTLTFPPGVISQTITVPILNDGVFEGAETFNVNLVTPTNATIADPLGIGTIKDDGTGPGVNDQPAVSSVSSPTTVEGGNLDFTVTLNHPSTTPTVVTLIPASGTATLGTDTGTPILVSFDGGTTFVPVTGPNITVPPGATGFIVRIPTVDDTTSEPAETLTLAATTPVNAGPVTGTGTILDNEIRPTLAITGPAVIDEGAGTVTYTVTLSGASSQPVSVTYNTLDGTARAGQDYTAASGTLTFAPGELTKTIVVPITNDKLFEGSENFTVALSAPSNATITTGSVLTAIVDDGTAPVPPGSPPGTTPDDDTPKLSVTGSDTLEGSPAVFTVTLSNPSTKPVVFTPSLDSGTATVGTDTAPIAALEVSTDGGTTWQPVTGDITIPAGSTSVLVRIPTTDDATPEQPETFSLTATPVSGATPVPATGTSTIIDNDGPPSLFIDDVTVDEAAGTATFTVTLSSPAALPVTVGFNTSNGTATSGVDFTGTTGTLTFAPGVVRQTITVSITDDKLFEGAETFNVNLTAPTNATIADGLGIGTIKDDGTGPVPPGSPPGTTPDDDTPKVGSVSSPTTTEGGNLDFTVTLTNPSTTPTVVTLVPTSGSATLGTDTSTPILVSFDGGTTFVPVTGPNVTVPPGATSFIVRIPTVDDPTTEPTETLTLGAATPANTAPVVGTGTITDNDGTPTLSIAGPAVIDEAAGTVTYTVTLSNASSSPVTVNYRTSDGTAKSGEDYTATNGVLTFAAGELTKTITVAITNDKLFEKSEDFTVSLSAASNATIATGSVLTAIVDDGTAPPPPGSPPGTPPDNDTPVLAVTGVNVVEGAPAVFTVSISNPSTQPVVFTPTLGSGTATVGTDTAPATALEFSTNGGTTWQPVTGNVTIPAGSTSVLVRIPTTEDPVAEGAETFTLTATPVSGSTPAPATGTATIIDNDGPPSLFIDDVTVNEAAGTATFTVTLSSPATSPVTVGFNTSDGTATAPADFTAVTGTLTFAPGVVSQTITVPIKADGIYEGTETFNVNLVAPVNATISDGQGVATIKDDGTGPGDDDTPKVSTVSSPTTAEGGSLDFTVTLTGPSTTPTVVTLTPASGTATLGTDTSTPILVSFDGGTTFVPVIGTSVTVPPGATSFIVRIPTVDDTTSEPAETLTLGAGTPANAAPVVGTGTITDNDAAPTLAITGPAIVDEGAGTVTYTVTLSNPASGPVTVKYATVDGTATAGQDYVAATGTLTFAPGQLTQTITVAITNDTLFEKSENFTVALSTPTNATIASGSVLTAIVDDGTAPVPPGSPPADNDTPKVGSVSSPTTTEGGNLDFTVTLTNPSTTPTVVTLTPASGTATLGTDTSTPILVSFDGGTTFVPVVGTTVSVPPGATSFIVRIPTVDDPTTEPTETLTLGAGTPANTAPVVGTGTITDNDGTPALTISGPALIDEGAGTVTYTVTLSSPSSSPVTVRYNTVDGTATAGQDYTAATGTLTFAPGQTTQTITVAITNDNVFEGKETFTVALNTPTNATITTGSVLSTIADDGTAPPPPGSPPDNDTPKVGSVSNPTTTEGGNLDFTVTLTNPSTTPTVVTLTPASGSATLGTDTTTPILVSFDGGVTFVPVVGTTVSVPPGATGFIVRIPTVDDTTTEPTETLTLGAGTPANTAPVVGTGTILDNEGAPTLAITGPALIDEGAGTVTYTVTLSNPSSSPVTVRYNTVDGTATAGQDYTAATGTLTFAPGQTTQTITVAITNDNVFEGKETFTVALNTPTNATITTGSVLSTIADDGTAPPPPGSPPDNDTPKVGSVSSPTTTEGGNLDFTVTLTNPSTTPTVVTLTPASGSATLGTDTTTPILVSFDGGTTFVPVIGTSVAVPPGATSFIVRIPTVDDTTTEPLETLTLGAGTPANTAPVVGTGTIVDNDGAPTLAITGPALIDEGAGTATYTVTLSNASSVPVTVRYNTVDGTATAGQDYTAATGTLTFAPGQLTQTITVAVTNDALFEGKETFTVALNTPVGAAIVIGSVLSTIADDGTAPPPPGSPPDNDTPKVGSVSSPTTTEGGNLDFTVTLTNPSTTPTVVTLTPASGSATLGTDTTTPILVSFDGGVTFVPVVGTTVSVPPGATGFIVRIPTVDDTTTEPTETLTLGAGTPANTAPVVGTGTILDNEGAPTLAITGPALIDEGAGTVTYTVTLSNPSSSPVTVRYNTVDGTATAGQDYTAATGTLTFAPGQTTQTITVAITNDNVFEGKETFTVALNTPTNATITTGSVLSTIADDGTAPPPPGSPPDNDTPKVGSVSSPTTTEGGNLDFTVTLTNPSTTPTVVTLTPASGSATLGTDTTTPILVSFDGGVTFVPVVGTTVSVPPGATSLIVRIPTVDDTTTEPTETLTLGAGTPANTAPVVGTGTILDNEGAPTLAITGPALIDEGAGTVTYTVTLSNPSSSPVTVRYNTVDGTATAGQDYTAATGTLTFAPGQTTQTITVAITNDNVFEGKETFTVALNTPTNATITTGSVLSTIADDGTAPPPPGSPPDNDTPKVGSVSSPTTTEGGNLDFTVTLTNPSTTPTVVTLTPASGSATLGTDTTTPILVSFDGGVTFVPVVGTTVSVPPGATSLIVRIPTVDDTTTEPTETLTLGAGTPANTAPVVGTGTILDNEGAPTLAITGPALIDEGAGTVTYTVTLSNPSSSPVTVRYNTVDGTATAGQDYTAATGTLTFAPGQTTQTITVAITNDNVFEGKETFTVALNTPTNATITTGSVLSTIADDGTAPPPPGSPPDNDTPKVGSVSNPTTTEGGNLDFTVTLTNPSTTPTVVTLTPASGSATLGTDTTTPILVSFDGGVTFVPVVGTTVSVPPGATGFIVRIPTVDDTTTEPTETLTLGAGTPANTAPVVGTGTILDNEGAPTLAITGPALIDEGAGTVTYTVTLSNPSSSPVTVRYNTVDGTATAGQDYTAATGTLTFAPGQTTQTITVAITNDNVFEGKETFTVALNTPTNATITTGSVLSTIADDGTAPPPPGSPPDNDTPKVGSVSSPTTTEGGNLDFTVTLTNPSTTPTVVTLTPASGSATLGTDTTTPILVSFDGGVTFVPVVGTTVSVPPGATGFIVRIPTVDDTTTEPTETLTLGAGTPANTAPVVGTGTILDNEGAPTLAITGPALIDEGAGTVTYTVTLSNPSSSPVTVRYNTVDGTATAGQDYTAATGTLTFAPGQTTQTITVAITNDTLFERSENFTVALNTPTNATIAVGSVLSAIVDDGTAPVPPGVTPDNDTPKLSIAGPAVVNETAGTVTYTVTLSNPSTGPVTVAFNTADGTATAGQDYTAASGTLTFAPGQLTQTITVAITNDTVYEGSETFSVNLSSPTGGVIVVGTTQTAIVDPEDQPTVSAVADARVVEGGNLDFGITLSNVATQPTALTFRLAGVTATVGTDTTAPRVLVSGVEVPVTVNADGSFTAQIPANTPVGAVTVRVPTANDTLIENTESLTLSVSTAANTAPLTGTGKILDNDAAADTKTTLEDTQATGNVFDNDRLAGSSTTLALTNFVVNGTSFAAGATATLAGIGTLTIGSNGAYTFTPALHYSGPVPQVTYNATKTDPAEGVAVPVTSTLDISVTPVADAPRLTIGSKSYAVADNFEEVTLPAAGYTSVLASSLGSPVGVWRTDNVGGANGGPGTVEIGQGTIYGTTQPLGATNKVLELEQDPGDRGNYYTVVSNAEAGEVYNVTFDYAARQNNGAVSNSVIFVYWENQLVQVLDNTSAIFQNYTFNLLATGPGSKLEFIAQDSNSFGGVLDNISLSLRQNTGIEGTRVNIPPITTSLVDADGSERLSTSISAIPVGATLTDGVNSFTATAGQQVADVSNWALGSIDLLTPTGLTGTVTLTVTSTATEIANGNSASTSGTVALTILPDTGNLVGGDANDALTGTAGNDRLWGLAGNDTITAGAGNDNVIGGAGTDTLRGEAGADNLDGGAGNDIIIGGTERDIISGGVGNDTLTGGTGAAGLDPTTDVFRWHLGDAGPRGTPALDVITDFNANAVAQGGDILDLRDLLQGENAANTAAGAAAALRNFLDFDTTSTPGSTVIRISTSGGFTNGTYAAGAEDERITLSNVDLRASFGLGAAATDDQVIQTLLNRGKLIVDGGP